MSLRFLPFICLLTVLTVLGCDRGGTPLSPSGASTLQIQDIATSAATEDAVGVLRSTTPPADGPGPSITVSGNQTVINGGTMAVVVESAVPLSRLFVYIGAKALGLATDSQGGIGGYYEIVLPAPRSTANVLLTFPQEIPLREFEVRFVAADTAGVIGASAGLPATVTLVGTGDVQVTLSWDVNSDVDLHVIDPSGEEIFYAHPNAASGGVLDLDSNAACDIDGVRNENITWPVGRAPIGRYTVRVDYWASCNVPRTNYTVRINAGGAPQIFTGSFTGSGDQGGAGSGTTITTFDRRTSTSFTFDVAPPASPSVATKGVKRRAGEGR